MSNDAFKIAVKLFAVRDDFAPDAFIPIFHQWIQNQSIEGHLLIDVADYAHVPHGPGTVLVSSDANFYMDRTENRLGLVYSRKLPLAGSFQERLSAAIREALLAAVKLQEEPALGGKLSFNPGEILVRLNDRLLAPNTAATWAATQRDFETIGQMLYDPAAFTLQPKISPLTLFSVQIRCPQPPAIKTLADRLGRGQPALSR